jgi:hypothetical protein
MISTFTLTDDDKIQELISKAPGNFFALQDGNKSIIPPRFYKDKRSEFWRDAKTYLSSDLAQNGIYTIMSGTSRKTAPIFNIQKGDKSNQPAPVIVMEDKSDIALVKENAELKAKLHYLELQLQELQESLEDAESTLEEGPEKETEKNPWLSLAEQLAPAAGQILAGIAAKYLQPTPGTLSAPIYEPIYRTPTGSRPDSPGTMEN